MAKPIITGCSAHPEITPEKSGDTVEIWGDYLVVADSQGELETPEVTCCPEDGVTFCVTPENLLSSNDVSLKATIKFSQGTINGMRKLKVKTMGHECPGQRCDAFKVVDATDPPDDSDDSEETVQSTK